jgi:nucleolar protein 53
MCEGLLEESDGEDEHEAGRAGQPEAGDGTTEISPTGAAGPEKRMEKKTEQQRRREKAARKLVSTLLCDPCGHTGPSDRSG